ncbi:hypothetical protein CXG81DRAFT_18671 [Caulochytrium protostelioides]|uniref:LIM zinc-binding domain-containing protein n=1 Tax=Caulochytrium protostelioides TaxID=1555241 RepID=A0A4P9X8I1_9FUNG|nr:hypothetical protein CXG81DRAFT_18671 [Caulochytrium protostelioides]|eukprot:RKP01565.1 hypothetical protein CXG81DRAFT_18671 [Caulochytrium protostelioides]
MASVAESARAFSAAPAAKDACHACGKTVYPMEKCVVDEKVMHPSCLRCHHCNRTITPATYAALDGQFYCKPHFKQLFQLKGKYTFASDQSAQASSSYCPTFGKTAASSPAAPLAAKTARSDSSGDLKAAAGAVTGSRGSGLHQPERPSSVTPAPAAAATGPSLQERRALLQSAASPASSIASSATTTAAAAASSSPSPSVSEAESRLREENARLTAQLSAARERIAQLETQLAAASHADADADASSD